MSESIAKDLWELSLKTNVNNLDKKHSNIVDKAKNRSFDKFYKSFRNWSLQSDCGIPFQFNLYSLKSYGILKYLRYWMAKIKSYVLYRTDVGDCFFDDLNIIKLINGYDILKSIIY